MDEGQRVSRIGANEAKTTLFALLDRVERGEEFVITRHHMAVARLVADGPGRNVRAARAAVAGLTRLRAALQEAGVRVSPADILAMKGAGR